MDNMNTIYGKFKVMKIIYGPFKDGQYEYETREQRQTYTRICLSQIARIKNGFTAQNLT